ncbi:nuclear transport factor 2 family protein [Segetibacter sp. 3557_3]|uniref:nuclear transport factor 2 family protein n=1 Tax=Segetibacter sp. 3557_3 TaxID=2547429 RepID=UPI001404D7A4|nr:nuclear transport factor 2 family protein [Segetibacter sp. 3557_3]
MKACFLSILLFAVVNVTLAQSADEKAVWARVEALNDAVFGTKDEATIRELVSTKLTYGHSAGNIEDQQTMIQNASKSKAVYNNKSTERLGLFFVDKTAIVRYIFRATSVENGNEAPLNISLLQVWAKEKNKWKLVARQAVRVSPK